MEKTKSSTAPIYRIICTCLYKTARRHFISLGSRWRTGLRRYLPSHPVLGCYNHFTPAVSKLSQLCLSTPPSAVARPASLPLPLWFQIRAWRMLLEIGFLMVCPNQPHFSAVSTLPQFRVLLGPSDVYYRSPLAIVNCRCASDRRWRMLGSSAALSLLPAKSHIRRAELALR